MKSFKQFFIEQNVDGTNETIAIIPGGFKPPTKGHFNAFRYILDGADKGVVFIGNKDRDGITPEHARQIWEVYSRYLGVPITVEISNISPVKSVYDFADANTDRRIIVGAGAKEEDIARFDFFRKNIEKYPLVEVVNIPIQSEGISGTKTRNLIQQDLDEAIRYFVPDEISESDKDTIKSILSNK